MWGLTWLYHHQNSLDFSHFSFIITSNTVFWNAHFKYEETTCILSQRLQFQWIFTLIAILLQVIAINNAAECFFHSEWIKIWHLDRIWHVKMFSSKINKFIMLLCSNTVYNLLYKGLSAKDLREILYILRNNQLMEMLSCGNCKGKV